MKSNRVIKKIKAKDLADAIETFAPLSTQAEWDNSGFTIGNPDKVVNKALIALNCTLDVVKEAIENKCDIIITHHPMIVHSPVLNLLEGDLRAEAIMLAIKNDIVIYSSHTPLDKARGGLNSIMAKKLGVKNPKVLNKDGFGLVGNLSREISPELFLANVKKVFNAPNIRSSKPLKRKIKRVAVSSGSGQGSIKDALSQGAQVLVTGDVTHHNFYLPDTFMVIDVGHHYGEFPAIELLDGLIKKNFPKFATLKSRVDKSPIYYF